MGQAKARGTFEQRKAEAEFYAAEQERLNEWLFRRRKIKPIGKHDAAIQQFLAVAFGLSFGLDGLKQKSRTCRG